MSAGAVGPMPLPEIGDALGCPLSALQVERLERYADLLLRWNAVYNLTSIRDPEAVRLQHLADCLAVVRPLRRELATRLALAARDGRCVRLLDVGSGGGLPGVVLAIAMEAQALEVTCVDAVGKKAAFVQQVAAELKLARLHAVHSRVERLQAPVFDVVAARAFSSLEELVGLTTRHLAPDGIWLAMKGRRPDDEIARLPRGAAVFHVEPLHIPGSAAERCIVWMRREVPHVP